MPVTVLMPALSPTMEKGKLAKWLKKVGDKVKSGDVLAEIETDKATMEIEAIDEGTLGKIIVAEGTDDVLVNAPIAVILGEGEKLTDVATKAPPPAVPATSPVKGEDKKSVMPSSPLAGEGGATAPDEGAAATSLSFSPSPKITAIGAFTNTSSVPSATMILPSVPSSMASISIVALSVSISASTSPDFTLSPSFFSHLASLPFSIVGERAGMKMVTGINNLFSLDGILRV